MSCLIKLFSMRNASLKLWRKSCCAKYYSNHQKQSTSKESNAYKFISSTQSPKKLSLDKNLNPDVFGPTTKKILRPVLILCLSGLVYFFYLAFNSEYDLEMEELLMKALPGYESSMMENKKYSEAIERLRRQHNRPKD